MTVKSPFSAAKIVQRVSIDEEPWEEALALAFVSSLVSLAAGTSVIDAGSFMNNIRIIKIVIPPSLINVATAATGA